MSGTPTPATENNQSIVSSSDPLKKKVKDSSEEEDHETKLESEIYGYEPNEEDNKLYNYRKNINSYILEHSRTGSGVDKTPIDQRNEELDDNYKTYFNVTSGNYAAMKQGMIRDDNNKLYYHWLYKFTDKDTIVGALFANQSYTDAQIADSEKEYVNLSQRCRIIADFLQTFTSIPLKARKLTRNHVRPSKFMFPIHPKYTATMLKPEYQTANGINTTFKATDDGSSLKRNQATCLTPLNASRVLQILNARLQGTMPILDSLIKNPKNKKGAEGDVLKEAADVIKADVGNALRFLTNCLSKSMEHIKSLKDSFVGRISFPTLQHGTYNGDYTDLFGFAITTWVYKMLKRRLENKNTEKDIIFKQITVNTTHFISDILVKRKSALSLTTAEKDKLIKKYTDKISDLMKKKDLYAIKDYVKKTKDRFSPQKETLNEYLSKTDNVDYEQIYANEIAEVQSICPTFEKKHIKNHVFLYPSLGRKIMLYTDINHFKYHISDSILSGLGVLMDLDVIPSNIFDDFKLCSIISGGVFSFKVNSSHSLDMVFDSKKPLLANMSDSEFVKYAAILDIHPYYNSSEYMEKFITAQKKVISECLYNSGVSLNQEYSYTEYENWGDFCNIMRNTYENFHIKKKAHLIYSSSDLNVSKNIENKIFTAHTYTDDTTKNTVSVLFNFINYLHSFDEFNDTETLKSEFENIKITTENIPEYVGKKIDFYNMKKIKNVPEVLIKDALTYKLILNNWVYIRNISVFHLKKQNTAFYPRSKIKTMGNEDLIIRTLPYDRELIVEKVGYIQKCTSIPSVDDFIKNRSGFMSQFEMRKKFEVSSNTPVETVSYTANQYFTPANINEFQNQGYNQVQQQYYSIPQIAQMPFQNTPQLAQMQSQNTSLALPNITNGNSYQNQHVINNQQVVSSSNNSQFQQPMNTLDYYNACARLPGVIMPAMNSAYFTSIFDKLNPEQQREAYQYIVKTYQNHHGDIIPVLYELGKYYGFLK